jgi:hypothetical protein
MANAITACHMAHILTSEGGRLSMIKFLENAVLAPQPPFPSSLR